MTTYKYDVAELQDTQARLHALAGDFAHASSIRDSYDGAMGYPSLRDAVQQFTDNWSHHRDKQIEAIDGAATMLGDICKNYVDFDRGATHQLYDGQ